MTWPNAYTTFDTMEDVDKAVQDSGTDWSAEQATAVHTAITDLEAGMGLNTGDALLGGYDTLAEYLAAKVAQYDTLLLTGEIQLTAASGLARTTGGCAAPEQVELSTNKINLVVADFDKDTDEYMQWSLTMPTSYDGGTVTAQFHWIGANAATDSVVWGLQGRAHADASTLDAAMGTAQIVTDANGGANILNISGSTAAITLAGTPAGGQDVIFQAYRDADNGDDDYAYDARLWKVVVTYTRA
jgi:hypothetical protein